MPRFLMSALAFFLRKFCWILNLVLLIPRYWPHKCDVEFDSGLPTLALFWLCVTSFVKQTTDRERRWHRADTGNESQYYRCAVQPWAAASSVACAESWSESLDSECQTPCLQSLLHGGYHSWLAGLTPPTNNHRLFLPTKKSKSE